MKPIAKKIVEHIMEDLFYRLNFPFEWGRESLYQLYFYEKGEEIIIEESFKNYKTFQIWMSTHNMIFSNFIEKLKNIRDIRGDFLSFERSSPKNLIKDLNNIIEDIRIFIEKNRIPLPPDIYIPDINILGPENFTWEVLSFYIKSIRFITFSINFFYYPKIYEEIILSNNRKYFPNHSYKLIDEKKYLQDLILSWAGIPSQSYIKEFYLPKDIRLEDGLEHFTIKDEIFIFHK